MLTLGYIVTDKAIKDKLDYVKIIKPSDYIELENNDLPTLIVGFDNARNFLGDRFCILDRKVNDNLYWTFWKTEKRVYYDKDLTNFYNLIFNRLKEKVSYQSISLFRLKLSDIKRLINQLKNSTNYVFIAYKTIFIYSPINNDKIIFGISFDELDYLNVKRDSIINKLLSLANNVTEKNEYYLSANIKNIFKSNKYIYAYLLYLLEKSKES